MNHKVTITSMMLAASSVFAIDPNWSSNQWDNFTTAIRQVETGGMPNNGIGAVGDGGDAIGPMQIHEACFKDAVVYDKSLSTHSYRECLTDASLSKRVCIAYIKRYLPKGGTPGDAARIWNGGPNGYKRSSTLEYLRRFLKIFRK